MTVINVSEQSLFDDVLSCRGLVLLICIDEHYRQPNELQTAIDELARSYRSVIRFYQVNMATDSLLKQELQLGVTPTFLLIRNGEVVDERNNIFDRNQLENFLEPYF